MNTQFMIIVPVLALLLMLLSLKHWSTLKRGMRRFYIWLYAMTFSLYLSIAFGYRIPMPTRFFINKVSPWVFSLLYG